MALAPSTCLDPRLAKIAQWPLADVKREFLKLMLDLPETYGNPNYGWLVVELNRIAPVLIGSTDPLEKWAVEEWNLPPGSTYSALALLALERLV